MSVDAGFYRKKFESVAGKYSRRWWRDKFGGRWWREGMAGRSGGKGGGKGGRETRRCERVKEKI
jgi:hypothetical protein